MKAEEKVRPKYTAAGKDKVIDKGESNVYPEVRAQITRHPDVPTLISTQPVSTQEVKSVATCATIPSGSRGRQSTKEVESSLVGEPSVVR